MGSYATLTFGHFTVGEWKYHIPLEPLLLFTQEDLHEEAQKTEDGYEYTARELVVSASVAKHRLDSRGFDLGACRRLFDEFRSDFLWDYGMSTDEDRCSPNKLDFDQYLSVLKRRFSSHNHRHYVLDKFEGKDDDPEFRLFFQEDFFDRTAMSYFEGAEICVFIRALLEVVPPDCSVVFDLTDLVEAEYLSAEIIPYIYDHFMKIMLRRIELDYQLYGYVIQDDPNVDQRLRKRIDGLSEDQFIEHVLLPLLDRMGFQRVRKVRFHGRNEFGSDILPFRYRTPLGTLEYYAVQAKAAIVHGTSATSGNAGELISQAIQALSVTFVDDLDNERKTLDKFIIASSKGITPDARRVIEDAIEGKRRRSIYRRL
jgi:hypothetical protein